MTKPWKEHRQKIVQLYIDEGRTLHDVRSIMQNRFGFEASVRSYRQHFDQWGVAKYNCKKRQYIQQAAGVAMPTPQHWPAYPVSMPSGPAEVQQPADPEWRNDYGHRRHSNDQYRAREAHDQKPHRLSLPFLTAPESHGHDFFGHAEAAYQHRPLGLPKHDMWEATPRVLPPWGDSLYYHPQSSNGLPRDLDSQSSSQPSSPLSTRSSHYSSSSIDSQPPSFQSMKWHDTRPPGLQYADSETSSSRDSRASEPGSVNSQAMSPPSDGVVTFPTDQHSLVAHMSTWCDNSVGYDRVV
jgi:hypothetical protein